MREKGGEKVGISTMVDHRNKCFDLAAKRAKEFFILFFVVGGGQKSFSFV
jgi:hypothetical protein